MPSLVPPAPYSLLPGKKTPGLKQAQTAIVRKGLGSCLFLFCLAVCLIFGCAGSSLLSRKQGLPFIAVLGFSLQWFLLLKALGRGSMIISRSIHIATCGIISFIPLKIAFCCVFVKCYILFAKVQTRQKDTENKDCSVFTMERQNQLSKMSTSVFLDLFLSMSWWRNANAI